MNVDLSDIGRPKFDLDEDTPIQIWLDREKSRQCNDKGKDMGVVGKVEAKGSRRVRPQRIRISRIWGHEKVSHQGIRLTRKNPHIMIGLRRLQHLTAARLL